MIRVDQFYLVWMSSFVSKFVLVLLIVLVEIDVSFKSALALTHGSSHQHVHDGRDASSDFSNQWIVHLEGSSEAADLLAMKLGYKNLGEVRIGGLLMKRRPS